MLSLPVVLRSAAPVLCLVTLVTLLTGCNQNPPQSASNTLPDLHAATYVGSQFNATPATFPRHHMRSRAVTLSVAISRHAPR